MRAVDEFVAAVLLVRDGLLETVNTTRADDPALLYVQDEARLSEADEVAPCVLRFVTAEISISAGSKPVGRFAGGTKTSWAPPIGSYMPRSRETRTSLPTVLRRLAVEAVAQGYFAMVEAEALGRVEKGPSISLVQGRTAEWVWPFWVTNISTGELLRAAAHPEAVRRVANACGENVFNGLQGVGLGRWRRAWKRSTGSFYGEAGMLLRMLQTDLFEPGARDEVLTLTNAWPFDHMPIG